MARSCALRACFRKKYVQLSVNLAKLLAPWKRPGYLSSIHGSISGSKFWTGLLLLNFNLNYGSPASQPYIIYNFKNQTPCSQELSNGVSVPCFKSLTESKEVQACGQDGIRSNIKLVWFRSSMWLSRLVTYVLSNCDKYRTASRWACVVEIWCERIWDRNDEHYCLKGCREKLEVDRVKIDMLFTNSSKLRTRNFSLILLISEQPRTLWRGQLHLNSQNTIASRAGSPQ